VPIEDFRRLWLSAVYQRYAKDVYNVIRFRLRSYGLVDAADDLLQEVFLTALEKCEGLVSHPDIRRWLFLTASNKIMNHVGKKFTERRRVVKNAEPCAVEQIPDLSAESILNKIAEEEIDIDDMIRRVKDGLSEPDRQLYAQAYEGKASPAELSEVYGISEVAVRMRISRLRKRVLFAVKSFLYGLLQSTLGQIIK
jgi:RNA polymerase sigma-70 factor (ECF subfamily)